MPLRVIELAQGAATAFFPDAQRRPAFARSQAYDVLTRELDRYCKGEVRGRSFLISGHRGSGKTSLVLRAVDDLAARIGLDDRPQRPLLVKLHGPSLISRAVVAEAKTRLEGTAGRPGEEAKGKALAENPNAAGPLAAAAPGAAEAGNKDGANKAAPVEPSATPQLLIQITKGAANVQTPPVEASATQQVLIQITIALYRALSTEIARGFRSRAVRLARYRPDGDFLELAAQLQLELDNAPSPAAMRGFWRKLDALRSGVLREAAPLPPAPKRWLGVMRWVRGSGSSLLADQGMRELVAVATAGQAFQVVSGAITYETVQKASAESESALRREVKVDIKDAMNALLGLIAGGLVGAAALFQQSWGLGGAAAAGLGTALVTQWGLTLTSARTRRQTVSTEYRFLRDLRVETLDRDLPLVIERIRDAGLAPVFLVDELDKIDGLESSMAQLVQRMKHLVADYSFFCFLTDRDYFEYLFDLSRREAYPREHTYFSHRLFVLYRPRDLHAYLDQLLHVTAGPPQATVVTSDQVGKRALAHLLLHRAMMHTFDLQRELARLCDEAGNVTLSADQLVSHLGYRFNIMVQLAIEHLLNEEEMRDRLDQDPLFGQLAYDALYYVSRSWLGGGGELDVDDASIDAYLAVRLKDRHDGASEPEAGARIGEVLGPLDRQFLINKVRRIANLLANPVLLQNELLARADLDDLARQLIETIPASDETRLLSEPGQPFRYSWRWDAFGRRLIDLEMPAVAEERRHADDALIDDVSALLAELRLSPTALAESGVLRTSPAWTQVQEAQGRLKGFFKSGEIYEQLEHDQVIVREYAAMLSAQGKLLAVTLAVAGVIAHDAGMEARTGIRAGVEALERAVAFRSTDVETAITALNLPGLPFLPVPPPVMLENDTFGAWRAHIEETWRQIEQTERTLDPSDARSRAWDSWRDRLEMNLPAPQAQPPGYYGYPVPDHAELVVEAVRRARARAGEPGLSLRWDLAGMTVGEWSRLLLAALDDYNVDDDEYAPLWAVFPALAYLGLGGFIFPLHKLMLDMQSEFRKWARELPLIGPNDWPTTPPLSGPPILLLALDRDSIADGSPPLAKQAVLAIRKSALAGMAARSVLSALLSQPDRLGVWGPLVVEWADEIGAVREPDLPQSLQTLRRIDVSRQPYGGKEPLGPDQLCGVTSLKELIGMLDDPRVARAEQELEARLP